MTTGSEPRYITIAAAVRRYGRSRSSIYVHLQRKDFVAITFNRSTLISVRSADAYFDAKPEWESGARKVGVKASVRK
jgi:hypothetical protein